MYTYTIIVICAYKYYTLPYYQPVHCGLQQNCTCMRTTNGMVTAGLDARTQPLPVVRMLSY